MFHDLKPNTNPFNYNYDQCYMYFRTSLTKWKMKLIFYSYFLAIVKRDINHRGSREA
jgi:hypothetical protein